MIKINLLNDVKGTSSPDHHERSEKEHKELITTANKGIGAIRQLKKHYSEETIINTESFGGDELSTVDVTDVEEMEFKIK